MKNIGCIRLTDEGIKIAKSIRNRHEILAEFFSVS
jgi:Mn-dependent DtxR family transcriptional regulator